MKFAICVALSSVLMGFLVSAGAATNGPLVIPHIPVDAEKFTVSIVVDNLVFSDRALQLSAYDADGNYLSAVNLAPKPNERLSLALADLFPDLAVTHLLVWEDTRQDGLRDSLTGILAGVHIAYTNNPAGGTFIAAVERPARIWRIYPGDWRETFDGVAMIDMRGCGGADISLNQVGQDGVVLSRRQLPAIGKLYGKRLINLGSLFEPAAGSYVELISDEYLAVIGLSGSLAEDASGAYLINDNLIARPEFEGDRHRLEEQRAIWQKAGISAYRYTYQNHCFCAPDVTRPAIVIVDNDTIVGVSDAETGEPVPEENWIHYQTIEQLFDRVEGSFDSQFHIIELSYDSRFGFPSELFFDPNLCAFDEEDHVITSDFRVIK